MKRNDLRNDLIVIKKLRDKEFKKLIRKAYHTYKALNIKDIKEYYTYQLYLNDFNNISYEDIISYSRLLDYKYRKDVELLNNQLENKCKILTFVNYNKNDI